MNDTVCNISTLVDVLKCLNIIKSNGVPRNDIFKLLYIVTECDFKTNDIESLINLVYIPEKSDDIMNTVKK